MIGEEHKDNAPHTCRRTDALMRLGGFIGADLFVSSHFSMPFLEYLSFEVAPTKFTSTSNIKSANNRAAPMVRDRHSDA